MISITLCLNLFFGSIAVGISDIAALSRDIKSSDDILKYFYIYEDGDWPKIATSSYYKRDPNERLQNVLNNGAGPVVDESTGAYHTDQYQLFSMIYNRALKDHRRTLDPSIATSFLIPYDFASDSAYYKDCVRSSGVCYDFRRCPLAPEVEQLLQKSQWYQRKQGADHVLIVGMNYAMDHYILKPKCKSLLAGTCRNCTKFAIDDYSYMYASDAGILARGDYWHAAPFPADFHWHRGVQRPFPWENTDRPILASYIGSTHSYYGPSRRLRGSIVHYCGLHPEQCVHQSYGVKGTRFSFKVDGHRPLQLSQRSIFCFQPTGDLMTRKGLFDSLLQGCIPVVFDDLTASVMYTWHWEETFWREVCVTFPLHPVVHRYSDPVEALMKLYKEDSAGVARKQSLIRQRVFQLQYGLDGLRDKFQHASALPYLTLRENYTQPAQPASRTDAPSAGDSDGSNPAGSDSSTGSDASGAAPGAAAAPPSLEQRIYHTTRPRPSHGGAGSGSSSNVDKGSKGEVELVSNFDSNWPIDGLDSEGGEDGKHMRDAYDIVVDLFLGWHSGSLIRFRNATVPECWDGWLDKEQNRCRPGTAPQ